MIIKLHFECGSELFSKYGNIEGAQHFRARSVPKDTQSQADASTCHDSSWLEEQSADWQFSASSLARAKFLTYIWFGGWLGAKPGVSMYIL